MDPAAERYRGETGRRYHLEKRAVAPEAYGWIAQVRAELFAPQVCPEDTVFEYGVGNGWNLAALPCRRRIGYDVADAAEAAVREHHIEFIRELAVLSEAVADVVLCHHTLEHVLHPPVVLGELHRVLRPGGRLLLGVPWDRERRHRRFLRGEPNHHLYTWNAQTLGNLVEDCGFEARKIVVGRYGYDRFAATQALRWHAGPAGFRCLRTLLQILHPLWEVRLVGCPR